MTSGEVCLLAVGALIIAPRVIALAMVPSRMRKARRKREAERSE